MANENAPTAARRERSGSRRGYATDELLKPLNALK